MNKKPLLVIFLVVFIDLLGFGIVIPILPYYAHSFGASATLLGVLMMCYSGMQFLFSPFWGALSDRIGRRPVILTCILGLSVSMALLGLAPTLVWLFIARLIGGFFGANISAASAYIADITPPEKRAQGMGIIGAAFGLGFLFGPAIGGFLSQWGYGTAALAASGLSAFNFILALFILKEPPLSEEKRKEHRSHWRPTTWKIAFQSPQIGLSIVLFFLITFGIAQLETTFGLFLLDRFKLDATHAGFILALMALIMVGIQGGAIGRLVQLLGESKLIILGTALMALALLAASFSLTLPLFVFFLLLQATGYAITNPSLNSLASRHSPAGIQGSVMGIYQSAGSLARVLGPLAAGILFDHTGISSPFMVASGLFGLSLLIVLFKKEIWSKTSSFSSVVSSTSV